MEATANCAGCQVAHINRRDRKLKGQGPKTGSGSTNQSISSPFLAFTMAFIPRCRCSACPVWGGRSWLPTPLNGSVTRLGQGLVSRCRARHFCRVDHSSAGWSSSSPVQKFHFLILFTPLFSVACEFYFAHFRFWSDKCFVGEPAASSLCECGPLGVGTWPRWAMPVRQ